MRLVFSIYEALYTLSKPTKMYISYELYNTERSEWTIVYILKLLLDFEALTKLN